MPGGNTAEANELDSSLGLQFFEYLPKQIRASFRASSLKVSDAKLACEATNGLYGGLGLGFDEVIEVGTVVTKIDDFCKAIFNHKVTEGCTIVWVTKYLL